MQISPKRRTQRSRGSEGSKADQKIVTKALSELGKPTSGESRPQQSGQGAAGGTMDLFSEREREIFGRRGLLHD